MSKTFNSETFKKTFDAYIRKWHISEAILWILAFLPFLAYGIAKYLEHVKIEITPFLRVWHSWGPILGDITFGAIASGIVSIGQSLLELFRLELFLLVSLLLAAYLAGSSRSV